MTLANRVRVFPKPNTDDLLCPLPGFTGSGMGCVLRALEKEIWVYGINGWSDALESELMELLWAKKPLWRECLGLDLGTRTRIDRAPSYTIPSFADRLRALDEMKLVEYAPYLVTFGGASLKTVLDLSWQMAKRPLMPSPIAETYQEWTKWLPNLAERMHDPAHPLKMNLDAVDSPTCVALSQCFDKAEDVTLAMSFLPAECGGAQCQRILRKGRPIAQEAGTGYAYLLKVVCGEPLQTHRPSITVDDVMRADTFY